MADSNDGGFLRGDRTSGLYGPLIVQSPGASGAAGTGQGPAGNVVTDTATRAAITGSTQTLAAANTSRKSLTIYNEPAGATLYVKFGAAASTTSYKVQIVAGGYYEMPFPIYQGIVTAVGASALGNVVTAEGV